MNKLGIVNNIHTPYVFLPPQSTVKKQFETLARMVGEGEIILTFQPCSPKPGCDQTTITFRNPGKNTHPLSVKQRMDVLFNNLPSRNGFTAMKDGSPRHEVIGFIRATYPIGYKAKNGYNTAIYNTAIEAGAICAVTSCLVNFAKHYKTITADHFSHMCREIGNHLDLSLPAANHINTEVLRDHRDGLVQQIEKSSDRARAKRIIGYNVGLAHRHALKYVKTHGLDHK